MAVRFFFLLKMVTYGTKMCSHFAYINFRPWNILQNAAKKKPSLASSKDYWDWSSFLRNMVTLFSHYALGKVIFFLFLSLTLSFVSPSFILSFVSTFTQSISPFTPSFVFPVYFFRPVFRLSLFHPVRLSVCMPLYNIHAYIHSYVSVCMPVSL